MEDIEDISDLFPEDEPPSIQFNTKNKNSTARSFNSKIISFRENVFNPSMSLSFNHIIDNHPQICPYIHHLYESGYKVISTLFPFSSKDYTKIVDTLTENGFIRTHGTKDAEYLKIWKNKETSCLVLINELELIIQAKQEDTINDTLLLIEDHLSGNNFYDSDNKITFDLYFPKGGSVDYSTRRVLFSDFEKIYSELYPQYDITSLLEQFSKSPENILLLYGEPGTGKTSLIKFAFQRVKSVAYTKDVDVITNSKFWINLEQCNYDLVVLDDLDSQLSPRKNGEDNSFLSQLLSFTDGTFRNKTKIIITTNMKMESIDSALVRPGRLFDFLHLEPMTRETAKKVWTTTFSLAGDDFESSFGEKHAVISQAELMSEVKRLQIGIRTRTYIKDGSQHYTIPDKLDKLNILIGKEARAVGF